ncbi:nucleoside diphosphate kinase regulator [Pseudaminobacter sp. NGMCC 1.201702]|uniref:nucleoside diphosphate kinase regulator n=1 Tax=Pseudaminobacter sp. NGMCC 1.201702 TaxID=3391825 RepID=UPI0039F023C3
MQGNTKARRKPNIKVSKTDHGRLLTLANGAVDRLPEVSNELLNELDRARVVDDGGVPADTVQMGSTVTFKPDTGEAKTVTLVFPGEADISQGKVSILTPIGTALLGLSTGQSISWTARDGRQHELSVLEVTQTAAPDANGAAGITSALAGS